MVIVKEPEAAKPNTVKGLISFSISSVSIELSICSIVFSITSLSSSDTSDNTNLARNRTICRDNDCLSARLQTTIQKLSHEQRSKVNCNLLLLFHFLIDISRIIR